MLRDRRDGAPRASRGRRRALRRARVAITVLVALVLLVTARCSRREIPLAPWEPVPEHDPAAITCIVFLAGDAGEADATASPLLARLRQDIQQWAGLLGRDSAVVMLFLGDNVYPEGVRPPDHPERARDVATLTSQALVATPSDDGQAVVPVLFVAGNHDWGNMRGEEGLARLRNSDAVLDSLRAAGHDVALLPEPGRPTAATVDLPCGVRLLLFDTAWWLTAPPSADRRQLLDSIREAIASAEERDIVMAGHHPFVSAGPHGGLVTFWRTVFLVRLLSRSGALLQDLNSPPYRELRDELIRIFQETRPPLLYAGGHDHTLQVIRRPRTDVPRHTLISGSASKLQGVDYIDGLLFRASRPGFMRLVFTRDGGVYVFVTAGDEDALSCSDDDEAARARCVADAAANFETAFSAKLR